jgi:hypothetical protein
MRNVRIPFFSLLAAFGVAIYGCSAAASILYVNGSATGIGDGSSWTDAYKTIQAAVTVAVSGDEIWVAKGAYTATTSPIVAMKAGVALYGGFLGTENSRDLRNPAVNATIIDGESSRQCITGASNATLDGFTIQNGRITTSGGGAGMSNSSCSSLTVANCVFNNNGSSQESVHEFGFREVA